MMDGGLYARLAKLLQWQSEDDLLDATKPALLATALRRFEAVREDIIANFPEHESLLIGRFEALDEEARTAIVTSPEGFLAKTAVADGNSDRAIAYYENAIGYAEWQAGRAPATKACCWSALGDACIWFEGGRYVHWQAPRIGMGVALDFTCPATRGQLYGMPGGNIAISGELQTHIAGKVDAIARTMCDTAPAMQRFFRDFARVFVIRTDPAHDRFIGGSVKLTPGRVVLLNAHLDSATPEAIMDGMIHETIHSVIDHAEFVSPMIRDPAGMKVRIVSPWSGRDLDANTYLQACFVWYGLACYFVRLAMATGAPGPSCLFYRDQASAGFRKGSVTAPLRQNAVALAPGLYDALDMAQAHICDAMAV